MYERARRHRVVATLRRARPTIPSGTGAVLVTATMAAGLAGPLLPAPTTASPSVTLAAATSALPTPSHLASAASGWLVPAAPGDGPGGGNGGNGPKSPSGRSSSSRDSGSGSGSGGSAPKQKAPDTKGSGGSAAKSPGPTGSGPSDGGGSAPKTPDSQGSPADTGNAGAPKHDDGLKSPQPGAGGSAPKVGDALPPSGGAPKGPQLQPAHELTQAESQKFIDGLKLPKGDGGLTQSAPAPPNIVNQSTKATRITSDQAANVDLSGPGSNALGAGLGAVKSSQDAQDELNGVAERLHNQAGHLKELSADPSLSDPLRASAARGAKNLATRAEGKVEEGRKLVPFPMNRVPEDFRKVIARSPWDEISGRVNGIAGKVLKPVTNGVPYVSTGATIATGITDVVSGKKSWQRATAEGVGSIAGGIGGGAAGRLIGAGAGTLAEGGVPGPGTAAGMVGGEIVGSIGGSLWGQAKADEFADEHHWR